MTPHTPHGTHKLALEEQLRESGADHLILRLGHLVGPYNRNHQLTSALPRRLRNGVVRWHGGATRVLIHVGDAMTVIDRLLEADLQAETVNAASGFAVPVEDSCAPWSRTWPTWASAPSTTAGF
ncbi:NAD-dependent epimerase/dehydratase family protein [Streptomyces sp. NPDC086080]|uniref:NAD-dependent epimerase/dehydratase family protein n=1 Tax=Streptomyces sp. NPDC086080 TaxID=3365748 RepID=UPI0037D4F943